MYGLKDFTPRQVHSWVAQEAAKHTTPESRAERIASEQAFIAKVPPAILKALPRSFRAHCLLISALKATDPGYAKE